MHPKPIIGYRPIQESARKAPRIGTKLVAAVQMKSTFVAAVVSMLYSLHRYSIMFGISTLLAMFSNASLAVQEENQKREKKKNTIDQRI